MRGAVRRRRQVRRAKAWGREERTTYSAHRSSREQAESAPRQSHARSRACAPVMYSRSAPLRANPKSQICAATSCISHGAAHHIGTQARALRSQLAFSSRLEGFRSRCSTLAEWMYFRPRSSCEPARHAHTGIRRRVRERAQARTRLVQKVLDMVVCGGASAAVSVRRSGIPQLRNAPDSGCEERMTWCRSVSISSYTRYASLKKPTPGGFITSCAVHSRKRFSRKDACACAPRAAPRAP